jgi:hypothetical protein
VVLPRELLLTVRRVVGGIQVDRNPGGAPVQPAPLLGDHRVGQRVRHVAQSRPPDGVLEPRQRRLRGQGRARDRIAVRRPRPVSEYDSAPPPFNLSGLRMLIVPRKKDGGLDIEKFKTDLRRYMEPIVGRK